MENKIMDQETKAIGDKILDELFLPHDHRFGLFSILRTNLEIVPLVFRPLDGMLNLSEKRFTNRGTTL